MVGTVRQVVDTKVLETKVFKQQIMIVIIIGNYLSNNDQVDIRCTRRK